MMETQQKYFAYYAAGLGDVIRVIYQTESYKYISEATSPVPIIVASHNPFTLEIFRYHRNAKNFILYDLGHKFSEFILKGLRGVDITNACFDFVGFEQSFFLRKKAADGYVPTFDAPDDVDSKGHIVFQPFAGNTDARSFKSGLIEKIIDVLRRQNRQVYILTRSYIRKGISGKVVHSGEDASKYAGGNIIVLDNLSVPASLNLIKTCSAYIGSWSSMQQAAWFENKPVSVFYPVN